MLPVYFSKKIQYILLSLSFAKWMAKLQMVLLLRNRLHLRTNGFGDAPRHAFLERSF